MQSDKESFWQQVGIAIMLLFYGIEWLLKNRKNG